MKPMKTYRKPIGKREKKSQTCLTRPPHSNRSIEKGDGKPIKNILKPI